VGTLPRVPKTVAGARRGHRAPSLAPAEYGRCRAVADRCGDHLGSRLFEGVRSRRPDCALLTRPRLASREPTTSLVRTMIDTIPNQHRNAIQVVLYRNCVLTSLISHKS